MMLADLLLTTWGSFDPDASGARRGILLRAPDDYRVNADAGPRRLADRLLPDGRIPRGTGWLILANSRLALAMHAESWGSRRSMTGGE